ncbi:MAG TPA: histidine kinase [Bacteroidia bacterium]|nr:histidine kinase [Bacteroidia bacterium]
MNLRIGKIALNIIACFVFLTLPILMAPDVKLTWDFITHGETFRDLIAYSIMIGYFYANYYYFIPEYFLGKRHLLFYSIALAALFLVLFLPSLISPHEHHPDNLSGMQDHTRPPHPEPPFFFLISHNLFLFVALFLYTLVIRISNQWKQAQKERLNAELSFLKAQVNPHFLFNTLNGIYSTALDENAMHSANAIVQLSGMMRYVMTEAAEPFVPLEKEVNYITSYIELQKIRLGNTVKIDFTVTGLVESKKIAPLILIPFVENAFKHGVNPDYPSYILVNILIKNSDLEFQVFNTINRTVNQSASYSGLGLKNVRQRLELIYPGKHKLKIQHDANDFSIFLSLHLK